MYNYTNLTNIETPLGILTTTNDSVGGWMGILILIAVFIIAFIALDAWDNKTGTLAAIFLTLVTSLLFRAFNFITDIAMYVTMIVAAIALVGVYVTKSDYP